MRITRDVLMKLARETVTARVRQDRTLMAIFLTGSLLEDDFLLGGTTDVDLVILHSEPPPAAREFVPLSPAVHLDISHHAHKDYRQTRRLRDHPWMGPMVFSAQILHDPQHFLDFTQASVRGQFAQPEHVMARAGSQAAHAREMWAGFARDPQQVAGPAGVSHYLKALDHAVNAVALLSGPPLTERRLLLRFPARAAAVGRSGMAAGLIGLLGGGEVAASDLAAWLGDWDLAFDAAAALGVSPARLPAARRAYYREALAALLASAEPRAALWPLVRTWTHLVQALPQEHAARAVWLQALTHLGLVGEGMQGRLAAFDAYLDQVEEALESWGRQNGVGA